MFILYKKDVFESFNGKYLKIPIGKALISIEEIIVEFAGGLIYMKKVIALSLLLVTLSACSVNSASDNIDFNQDYGHFYDLREEFHLGNISYDDLLNISYYNNDGIPTLEPVWNPGGGSEVWVDWFMKETFCGSGISIQYTQAGQENSFGWDRMGKGLEFQYPYIKKMADEGRAEVMTLKESGKWFLDNWSLYK